MYMYLASYSTAVCIRTDRRTDRRGYGYWRACLRLGLPLTSIYLLEYSSEYLNEYSSTR